MNISLKPGTYVLAVSGGVDSMALLHMLSRCPEVRLVVAHFDHGIRADSVQDRLLVQKTAKKYGLPFVYHEGRLGENASEAVARQARYDFLNTVLRAAKADGLVTAHHQDDALETAIINLVRGTGRKGLSSLRSTDIVKRPLLHVPKVDLRRYAEAHSLVWRDDSTNTDPKYFRNHIRLRVIPQLRPEARDQLHQLIIRQRELNQRIDELLQEQLMAHTDKVRLDRRWFINLPHDVSREVMASWLRGQGRRNFDKKLLERLTHGAKIHKVGKRVPVDRMTMLRVGRDFLALETVER